MQARAAARSWSAASTSAGDVLIQQARGAARLWSAASTSAGWSRWMQARGAARLWSAASTSAGDVLIQQARAAARLWSAASTSAVSLRWLLALAAAAVGLSPSLALLLPDGGCGESIAVVVPVKEEKNRKPLRVRTFLAVRSSVLAVPALLLRFLYNGCMDRRILPLLGGACSCGSFRTIRSKRRRFAEGGLV